MKVRSNTKNWTKKKALPPCGISLTDAGNEYPCHGELRLPLSGFGERRSQGGFELRKQAGFKSTRDS